LFPLAPALDGKDVVRMCELLTCMGRVKAGLERGQPVKGTADLLEGGDQDGAALGEHTQFARPGVTVATCVVPAACDVRSKRDGRITSAIDERPHPGTHHAQAHIHERERESDTVSVRARLT
jgi:hypothetical protein